MAVDLWNARGEDVAAGSQLGCPATAVVPRVSGSGKPPVVHIRGQLVPKPPATAALTSHLPSSCGWMSEKVKFIVSLFDVGRNRLIVKPQHCETCFKPFCCFGTPVRHD